MKQKFDLKKIPKKFYSGLSKLFYKLGINGNEIIDDFIYSYIDYAYNQSKKRNDIYLSTGFGRKFVNNYFNDIKYKTNPKLTQTHRTLISQLQVLFKASGKDEIPIFGKENSFNSAFNLVRPHYSEISAKSMLKKLVRVGVLEVVGTKHIKLITSIPTKGLNDPEDVIRVLTDTLNRLCHTVLFNMSLENNDDGLTQSSYWSNSIDPKHYESCKIQLRTEIRRCIKNCSIIIDKFEEKGLSKKAAEAKNIEFGVSAFIFKNPK